MLGGKMKYCFHIVTWSIVSVKNKQKNFSWYFSMLIFCLFWMGHTIPKEVLYPFYLFLKLFVA